MRRKIKVLTSGLWLIPFAGVLLSCSLEGSNMVTVTCGINVETELFVDLPPDTAYVQITASELQLDRIFLGLRRPDSLPNPVDGAYTNLVTYERLPDIPGLTLKTLGVVLTDPSDSAAITLGFDFREATVSDQVCRVNKTLQAEHNWSRWEIEQQGAFLRIVFDDATGNPQNYSTNTLQADTLQLTLESALILDEFETFGRLQGSFQANMLPEGSITTEDAVSVSGSFVIPMQVGYPFSTN